MPVPARRRRGGRGVAWCALLIVGHGLRQEAAAEARQVAAWLRARRIDHHVLRWTGAKPATGIQAAAREARYVLGDWCRTAGLHLLLGHHLDDQAETVALRQARQSGAEGLAGMAAVRELAGLRLLRPLLILRGAERASARNSRGAGPAVARGSEQPCSIVRARAGCAARGWMRPASPARLGNRPGGVPKRRRMRPGSRATRASTRRGSSRLRAEALAWRFRHRHRAVQQILMTVSGRHYPPRQARLERLLAQLRAGWPAVARSPAAASAVARRAADLPRGAGDRGSAAGPRRPPCAGTAVSARAAGRGTGACWCGRWAAPARAPSASPTRCRLRAGASEPALAVAP